MRNVITAIALAALLLSGTACTTATVDVYGGAYAKTKSSAVKTKCAACVGVRVTFNW